MCRGQGETMRLGGEEAGGASRMKDPFPKGVRNF